MKEKSSIGIMKLLVGIVVVVVVIVCGAFYIRRQINTENIKNMQADLLLVQAKTELVKGKYEIDKENNPLKGYKLTQLPEGIEIQEFYDKNIIAQEEYEKYYLLNSESLEQCGLVELAGKYEGYFIVNYDNYEVIYTKGYENTKGLWCYKISDINKENTVEKQ